MGFSLSLSLGVSESFESGETLFDNEDVSKSST